MGSTGYPAREVPASSPGHGMVWLAQPLHSCSLCWISIATRFTAHWALLWAACNAFVPWADRAAGTRGTSHVWLGKSLRLQPPGLPWETGRSRWGPGSTRAEWGGEGAPGPEGPALRADGPRFSTQELSVIQLSWAGIFEKGFSLKTLKENSTPKVETSQNSGFSTKLLWSSCPPMGPDSQGDATLDPSSC